MARIVQYTARKFSLYYAICPLPAQAFDYRLGNRSALEWIIDQYRVKTAPRSGFVNDPNRPHAPHYIARLIGKVITNVLDETVITQVAQNANELRWQVEEFHRELKQLIGSAKCQYRKARSQRNHLACCYHAWLSLKVHVPLLNKTIYRVHTDLFSDYLRNQLRCPTFPAFQPT